MQITNLPIALLVALGLTTGCTVVPDPTSGGVNPVASNSGQTLYGNWKAKLVTTTSVSVRRLSISKGMWYQRWTTDSLLAASGSQTTLLEQGSWSWSGADSSLVILAPTYRQVGTLVGANILDTIQFQWKTDTLSWISKRDSLDTISWLPG